MKALEFQVVAAAQEANSINEFSAHNLSVCDMCWGDLSL